MHNKNIVITGYWDNQPIWRFKTPEEKLVDENIKPETGKLFIALSKL